MGFFDRFSRPSAPQQQPSSRSEMPGMFGTGLPDPVQRVNEIERNPAMLSEIWQLPQGMTDGNQILDYLVQSGQVNPALLRNPLVMAAASALSAKRK